MLKNVGGYLYSLTPLNMPRICQRDLQTSFWIASLHTKWIYRATYNCLSVYCLTVSFLPAHLSFCLFVYMIICLYDYLSIWLFVYLSIWLFVYLSIWLFVYMIICLFFYMIICLVVCLFICIISIYMSICLSICFFKGSLIFFLIL